MPHMESPLSSPHQRPPQNEDGSSSPTRTQRIRIKNRRKLYLDRHPSYFSSPDLELADPLLYDRCIRRFLSAEERQADGKKKGYSGVLEADLYRSEARLAALRAELPENPDPDFIASPSSPNHNENSSSSQAKERREAVPFVSFRRGDEGPALIGEDDEPKSKEDGWERWKFEMTVRFLRGEDEDFEYGTVDEGSEDEVERREREEKYFDEEEPAWDGREGGTGGDTGIQDF